MSLGRRGPIVGGLIGLLALGVTLGCGLESPTPTSPTTSCQRPATELPPLAPLPATYQGFHFGVQANASPTRDKPQNKLWYNDRAWWAVMLSPEDQAVRIFELLADQSWRQTDAVIDDRVDSTADVRWDGQKLYVASRHPTLPLRVLRFSYHSQDRSYELDSGFPVSVNAVGTSSANIERDSTGRLWVAYIKGRQLWVAHSAADQLTWAPPFKPMLEGTTTSVDDVASLVALDGMIGLMWSNQATDEFYFATHADRDPPEIWSVERPLAGAGMVDNHVDLKAWNGSVYAVVKTSLGDDVDADLDAPLVLLLVRTPDGTWGEHVFGTVADLHTRPIALIDRDNENLYIFATRRHEVVYKVAPIVAPEFPPGPGSPFVSYAGAVLIDPTTSDQPVGRESGVVVLANSMRDRHYYHAQLALDGAQVDPIGQFHERPTAVITLRSATVGRHSSGGQLSLVLPERTAEGDLLLASVDSTVDVDLAPPPGWHLVRSDTDDTITKSTYFRVATASEPRAHVWGLAAGQSATGIMLAYVGTDADYPIEGASGQLSRDSPFITGASLDVTNPGSTLIGFFSSSSTAELVPPPMMTEVASTAFDAAGSTITSKALQAACPAAGPTGDMAVEASSELSGVAHLVLLRPAPVPVAEPLPTTTIPPRSPPLPSPGAGQAPIVPGISFRSASADTSLDDTVISIDRPARIAAGDLLLASIDTRGTPELTPPFGWTLLRSDTSDRAVTKSTYYRVADSVEPHWYTWFMSRPASATGTIVAYAGVDREAPIDVVAGLAGDIVAPTVSAPSASAAAAGSMLVAFFTVGVETVLAAPDRLEKRIEIALPPADHMLSSMAADRLLARSGPTAELIATGQRAGKGIGQVVVLRPADLP